MTIRNVHMLERSLWRWQMLKPKVKLAALATLPVVGKPTLPLAKATRRKGPS